MSQFLSLKFYYHKAAQQAIVKHKVSKKLIILYEYSFLTSNESKAITQLQQKLLQVCNKSLLQVFFIIRSLTFQTKEFQNHRIFYYLLWLLRYSFFTSYSQHAFLIITQQEAFIQLTVNLALHLASCPSIVNSLKLVILSFIIIWNCKKQSVLSPVEL